MENLTPRNRKLIKNEFYLIKRKIPVFELLQYKIVLFVMGTVFEIKSHTVSCYFLGDVFCLWECQFNILFTKVYSETSFRKNLNHIETS